MISSARFNAEVDVDLLPLLDIFNDDDLDDDDLDDDIISDEGEKANAKGQKDSVSVVVEDNDNDDTDKRTATALDNTFMATACLLLVC